MFFLEFVWRSRDSFPVDRITFEVKKFKLRANLVSDQAARMEFR